MHLQPVFSKNKLSLPKSESLADKHLCLPMHFGIKEEDANFIIDKFINSIKYDC